MLPDRVRQDIRFGSRRVARGAVAAAGVALLGWLVFAAVGCRATASSTGVTGAAAVAAGTGGQSSFQADLAPVTALAFTDPFLWIGSARGLRRFQLPQGPNDWIGGGPGTGKATEVPGLGRQVSALAADGSARLIVATEAGVVALSNLTQARPPLERLASLAGVTHLAVVGGVVYAGSGQGVFVVEGGNAVAVAGAGGVPVTSLDVDFEGKAVWAGLRGRGLARIEARKVSAAFGPSAPAPVDFVEPLGVAVLPNGTRVALGRNAAGATRVLVLRADGPELLVAQPEMPVSALVATPAGPVLIGGDAAAPRTYRLTTAARGESIEGGFRFSPVRKSLEALRMGAVPDGRELPGYPTRIVNIPVGTDEGTIFAGTRAAGVARVAAGKGAPEYLPVGELASDARRMSVACLERERCVFSTGAGPGWIWDGRERTVKPIPEGAIGGGLMALAGDGSGTVYFVTAGAGKNLAIARLSGDGGQWEHVVDVPVAVDGIPVVGFATLSPKGDLWMTVRDSAASGQEFGRGAIEVRLPAGRVTHHRPYTAKEKAPPEAIAISGDVAAIRFQTGQGGAPDAIWFCTATGVLRFGGGSLERWGENEGLENEHCNDLLPAAGTTTWMATDAGVARFDGKQWVPATSKAAQKSGGAVARWPVNREGENLQARSLVAAGSDVWAGTSKGLWPLTSTGRALDRETGLVDDDVVDAVVDRFGRVWVLGRIGLTIRSELRPAVR